MKQVQGGWYDTVVKIWQQILLKVATILLGILSHTGLCVFQLESTYNVAVKNMGRNGIDLEWNKVISADQIEKSIAEIKVL